MSQSHSDISQVAQAFFIQCRVVGALLMREVITRFGRHNLGFMWLFLEPMSFTIGVTVLWNVANLNHGTNISITAFAVTGYSMILLWRNCANRCSGAIIPNTSLLYHRNVKVIDIFLARVLLEVAGATLSFIILSIAFMATEFMNPPDDLLKLIVGWLFLIFISIGLGFIVGALSEKSETFERLWHTIAYLLFPLSGAAFLVDWLPQKSQMVVLVLPMVHASEMIREAYFGTAVVRAHYSIEYMAISALSMLAIGLALVVDTGKHVVPD